MKSIIPLVSAISLAGSLGCSSGPLSPEPGQPEADNGPAAGIGGGSATDKISAATASLGHAASDLTAPSEQSDLATLLADRNFPNHINPTLHANEWVCSLGTMQGNFQDVFGGAQTYIDTNSNEWRVRAVNGVIARANCVRLSRFLGDVPPGASDTTRWVSGEFSRWDAGGGCSTFRSAGFTWLGDAATIMTGAWGGFFGGAESVNVGQSSNASDPSTIYNTLCGQDMITTDAHSLFVGIPSSGVAARFRGPGGAVGDAAAAGEFVVDRSTTTLAQFDEAFCYFTSIRGGFAGDGEKAEIVTFTDPFDQKVYWAMRTHSQQGSLVAKARCYLWDQTTM